MSGDDNRETAFEEVPVISIAPLVTADPHPEQLRRTVEQIGEACRDVGFFYVTGHGVPQADSRALFDAARKFFALPLEEKMRIRLGVTEQFRGFVPLGGEVTGGRTDWHECLDVQPLSGRRASTVAAAAAARRPGVHPLDDPGQWPPALPEFRETVMRAWDHMYGLSARLAAGMALSLGLDEHHFAPYHGVEMSDLRMVHYPPYDEAVGRTAPGKLSLEEVDHGFGAHVDYGFLAVLQQDEVGGLEVRNPTGEWIPAPHIPGTFLVNIGQMMQRWTNDRYHATWHRVLLPGTVDRYSIPFFFEPAYEAVVAPLEVCVDEDNPRRYEPVQFGPHVVELFSKAYD